MRKDCGNRFSHHSCVRLDFSRPVQRAAEENERQYEGCFFRGQSCDKTCGREDGIALKKEIEGEEKEHRAEDIMDADDPTERIHVNKRRQAIKKAGDP